MRSPTGVIDPPGIALDQAKSAIPTKSAFPDPSGLVTERIDAFADDPNFITALARGLGVLLALSDKRRRMTIAQVSHRTGIPRAAARRSLHTLEKLGFVAADDARRFYLRPRVLSFSHGYLSASPIAVLAQPILDRLSELLREACSLALPDDDEIVYIARSSSSRIMSPSLNVGRRLPAYCTSIGHVVLAQLSQAELDDYIAHAVFYPYTEFTPNSAEKLLSLLAAVRESGFAFASQWIEPRLCTLAVPVRDVAGHYVAGINVILQGRLLGRDEMAERYYRPLHEASLELGSLLLP